jgi:membrane-associated protein
MNSLAEWALTILKNYGVLILFFISYFGSLGIPFPITPVIIAAGAFTRQGILDWRLAVLACLVGAALADHSEYFFGRWAGGWLKRRFGQNIIWQKALSTINRQGKWAILLTRFWLTSLAPAVNLLAGSRFPYFRFLLFDLIGELLWVLLYGGLGYIFAGQWKLVSQIVTSFSGLSVGLLILAAGIYFLVQRRRKAAWRHRSALQKWPWLISLREKTAVGKHNFHMVAPRIQKINHSWVRPGYDWRNSDELAPNGDLEWNAHQR